MLGALSVFCFRTWGVRRRWAKGYAYLGSIGTSPTPTTFDGDREVVVLDCKT